MTKKVLLLRGINVGGHGKLPMADLKTIMAEIGATNVETYIQSGNAVFDGTLSTDALAIAIEKAKGFRPRILILTAKDFETVAKANPFPDAIGNTLHIWFAATPFGFDPATAETLRKPNERIEITDKAIYLHAPDGIGRSKLAEKIEKLAGVACTARNLNTVRTLLDMIA